MKNRWKKLIDSFKCSFQWENKKIYIAISLHLRLPKTLFDFMQYFRKNEKSLRLLNVASPQLLSLGQVRSSLKHECNGKQQPKP
jgi:hypothetical protein